MHFFFFFNDTATTEIYTLSLHDALPISRADVYALGCVLFQAVTGSVPFPRDTDVAKMYAHVNAAPPSATAVDRKSTRLNSSHANISYAVFCLKKKHRIHHLSIVNVSGLL